MPKTDKICKYFISALENKQYGYRWKCPNGDECIYKHCLPLGYVLQDKTLKDDDIVTEDLEETLENMRQKLRGRTDLTPVTEESFNIWKAKWVKREEEELKKK